MRAWHRRKGLTLKKIAGVGLAVLMGSSLVVLGAPAAEAADRTCRGTISGTTISGNVRVPAGASCDLQYVYVRGNVLLGSKASVKIYGRGVTGNVQGEGAGDVSLYRTRIYGDVQLKGSRYLYVGRTIVDGDIQSERASYVPRIELSQVKGNVQTKYQTMNVQSTRVGGDIQHEEGAKSFIVRNTVGGNIQVFKNRNEQRISYNTVDGNLQCKENLPSPVGGKNTVRGNKEDQCRRL